MVIQIRCQRAGYAEDDHLKAGLLIGVDEA